MGRFHGLVVAWTLFLASLYLVEGGVIGVYAFATQALVDAGVAHFRVVGSSGYGFELLVVEFCHDYIFLFFSILTTINRKYCMMSKIFISLRICW